MIWHYICLSIFAIGISIYAYIRIAGHAERVAKRKLKAEWVAQDILGDPLGKNPKKEKEEEEEKEEKKKENQDQPKKQTFQIQFPDETTPQNRLLSAIVIHVIRGEEDMSEVYLWCLIHFYFSPHHIDIFTSVKAGRKTRQFARHLRRYWKSKGNIVTMHNDCDSKPMILVGKNWIIPRFIGNC